jgi:putative ABC transport system permease protein
MVLLVVAITAATATLTLGLALRGIVDEPYRETRVATHGPDLTARPRLTGPEALAALEPLSTASGVVSLVASRVVDQRRRAGLLKAVGAGPGMVAAVHLAEYVVIGLVAAGIGLTVGWLAAPLLIGSGGGLLGSEHPLPTSTVVTVTVLALAIALTGTLVPVTRAASTSTIDALTEAPAEPRRRRWRVWLSRRLPVALLIGVRINARRPRRARLVMVNALITTAVLAAVVMQHAQRRVLETDHVLQAQHIVVVVACSLALLNTAVTTWTAVLDARQPLAVARALGATPTQAAAGIAVAQLLPALPGVIVRIPFGIELILTFGLGTFREPPTSWMVATGLAVLVAIAALTAVPARRPVAAGLGG